MVINKVSIIVLLIIGLVTAVYLSQNPQIFKSKASVNVANAFEIKDSQTGEIINCRQENSQYYCQTNAQQVSFTIKDLNPIYELDSGKGCDDGSPENKGKSSCYNPRTAVRVPLDDFYSQDKNNTSSFKNDCNSSTCKYPTKQIPFIYDQTNVSIPEFANDPQLKCIQNTKDSVENSVCGPTSLAMIAESFNGHDPNNQTANNISRFFLSSGLMKCDIGTIDTNVLKYAQLVDDSNRTLQVRILEVKYGSFEDLEEWYRQTGYPTWTGVWYIRPNGDRGPHYATVAAISDNYVWLADPYKPEGQTVLKIPKAEFKSRYYRDSFWKIIRRSDPPARPPYE